MSGWIKTHRAIQDHWIFNDAEKLRAWMIILFTVNFEPKKVNIKNSLFECRRGESLLSLDSWALKFGGRWNKSKVRRFFKLLENDSMIVLKSERKTTRLIVCNYDTYQDERNDNETKKKRKRNDNETQTTPTKEGEELKNDKEYITPSVDEEFYMTSKKKKLTGKRLETFLIFWDKFNYKKSKADAAQAWFDIPKLTDKLCAQIYSAAEKEASVRDSLIKQGRTPKMAQGWITSKRWEDEQIDQISGGKPETYEQIVARTTQNPKYDF